MKKIRVYKSIDTARRSDLSVRRNKNTENYISATFCTDGGIKGEFSRIADAYRDYRLSFEF